MERFRLLFDHLARILHKFLSGTNPSSVFEWHKKLKEGRESVRDDERCGRSKEVNTQELIGQIKNFIDKDRRVSIETIRAQFDVSVPSVHTIIREELKMRKICAKFVPRVLRDQKERRCHDSRRMVELINSDPTVLDALATRWKLDLLLWPRDKESEFPVEACWLSQTQEGQTEKIQPTNFWWSLFFFWQHWHDLHALASHWIDSQQGIQCWFRRKMPAPFKSGQWHFHQDNAPVHNSILVTDYLSSFSCSLWLLVIP